MKRTLLVSSMLAICAMAHPVHEIVLVGDPDFQISPDPVPSVYQESTAGSGSAPFSLSTCHFEDGLDMVSGSFVSAGIRASADGSAYSEHNVYWLVTFEWIPITHSDVPDPETSYSLAAERYRKNYSYTFYRVYDPMATDWNMWLASGTAGTSGPNGSSGSIAYPTTTSSAGVYNYGPNNTSGSSASEVEAAMGISGAWTDIGEATISGVVFDGPDVNGRYFGTAYVNQGDTMESIAEGYILEQVNANRGYTMVGARTWYRMTTVGGVDIDQ